MLQTVIVGVHDTAVHPNLRASFAKGHKGTEKNESGVDVVTGAIFGVYDTAFHPNLRLKIVGWGEARTPTGLMLQTVIVGVHKKKIKMRY